MPFAFASLWLVATASAVVAVDENVGFLRHRSVTTLDLLTHSVRFERCLELHPRGHSHGLKHPRQSHGLTLQEKEQQARLKGSNPSSASTTTTTTTSTTTTRANERVQRYAMFHFCSEDERDACCRRGGVASSTDENGNFLMNLEDYLDLTITHFLNEQRAICVVAANDESHDHYHHCQTVANMETNGQIDATEFLECQMIYDPEDESETPLYAGPICAADGFRIQIGVFTDEHCLVQDPSKNVDDYLFNSDGESMRLSYSLLKKAYSGTCLACDGSESVVGPEDEEEALEICQDLYDDSITCEGQERMDVMKSPTSQLVCGLVRYAEQQEQQLQQQDQQKVSPTKQQHQVGPTKEQQQQDGPTKEQQQDGPTKQQKQVGSTETTSNTKGKTTPSPP